MLQKLGSLGYSTQDFGLHSFRVGGATAAAITPDFARLTVQTPWEMEVKNSKGWLREGFGGAEVACVQEDWDIVVARYQPALCIL